MKSKTSIFERIPTMSVPSITTITLLSTIAVITSSSRVWAGKVGGIAVEQVRNAVTGTI
ncbi:MAG: hypothetical protein IH859_09130, partial [Chloroflexi bacterium]|nr:hypothetical protein [Chloroflexota bacterium]